MTAIADVDEQLGGLPRGLSSFYDPLLDHEAREALEAGGEVFVSQDAGGAKDGLFIYDGHEATGTIFTRSREAFDRFFALKPSSYVFSELEVAEHPREAWNVWQLDVDRAPSDHRFKYQVGIDDDVGEIERFMAAAQPETNRKWVGVALRNGDKCFVVKIGGRIVGIAWMTIVGEVARSHGLYVEPQFRRMGVTRDNFHARLIYLKSRRVHTLINEIAESNVASYSHAERIGERVVGKLFLYTTPDGGAAAQPPSSSP
ncbi:MAG: GNAT family N-acetyltransferase [Nitrososphaerales archaeon]